MLLLALAIAAGTLQIERADWQRPSQVSPRYTATTPRLDLVRSVYLAAVVLDAETSADFRRHGMHEQWQPRLYGRFPTRLRFYAVTAAIDVPIAYGAWRLAHTQRPHWGIHRTVWRVAGWAILAAGASGHLAGGVRNLKKFEDARKLGW